MRLRNSNTSRRRRPRRGGRSGYSLVEMVVAAGIAGMIFSGAALIVYSVGSKQRRLSTYSTIDAGVAAKNYYPNLTGNEIDSYTAPNYGRAARADALRDVFWDDVEKASAVFCLGRTALNTVRPDYIYFPGGSDGRTLDSPEAFRALLASEFSQSTLIFQQFRGVSSYPNGTIFILQPSQWEDYLAVRAIYEIDIQAITTTEGAATVPVGTYACVRRYTQSVLTDFYDVLYPPGLNAVPFKPLFAFHERRARLRHDEGTSPYPLHTDNYKTAQDMPFYFIWWPDPAAPNLALQDTTGGSAYAAIPAGQPNPLPGYVTMAGRTSYFFTVPAFPSQL